MRFVGPVRAELGVPTVFNFLGPLTNPSRTRYQLVGVSDPGMAPIMADVFGATGSRRTFIVRADDGLDELSVTSPSTVLEVRGDGAGAYELSEWRVDPAALGLAPATLDDLRGGDAAFNAGGHPLGPRGGDGRPARHRFAERGGRAHGGRAWPTISRAGWRWRPSRSTAGGPSGCSTRWSLRRRRQQRSAGRRADPPGPAGRVGLGVERRRVGRAQRDDAAAEAAPAHAGAQDARLGQEVLDQLVHRRHRDQVVGGQAAVTLGHDLAQRGQVAPLQEALGLDGRGRTR